MDSYLERLQQELKEALGEAPSADLAKAPAGKWSPAQILEHLLLTYQGTNKGMAICLARGTPLATRGTLLHRVQTFVVVRLGYFPSGRRAPERTIPNGASEDQVRAVIFEEIARMDSALTECELKFGRGIKLMDHPILGPLNVYEWRKLHWLHGRHHARQIRERLANVVQGLAE